MIKELFSTAPPQALHGEAQNVLNFLEKEDVSESRMEAFGCGMSPPIADNNTHEGRQKNRRVEIIISVTEID